jgi:hypothetical protein
MRSSFDSPTGHSLLLALSLTLAGCAVPTSTTSTASSGTWTNWQIQAGTTIVSPPSGLYFVGAVETQGTQSSAAFTSGGPTGSGPQVVLDFLGTYNSSTGAFALYPTITDSAAYAISFTSQSGNTTLPVGIVTGCVYPLNYQGPECLAIASISPATGVSIASLTGTYLGTLTESNSSTLSGTATLTLTQSAAPNSSGQFPLSGTITFPSGSGFGSVPVGGTVAGEGVTLSDSSTAPNAPTANITAVAKPDGSQVTITNLIYSGYGPGAVFLYTGTLTRQ